MENSGKAVKETGFLQLLGGNTDWYLSMKKRRRNKISIRVSLLASGDECSVLRTSGLPQSSFRELQELSCGISQNVDELNRQGTCGLILIVFLFWNKTPCATHL